MNNLSWFIYWADAAPRLATAVCVISGLIFITSMIFVVLGLTGFFGDEARYKECSGDRYAPDYTYAKVLAPRFRKVWPLSLVAFLLWAGTFLVPAKDTFYLIAASEAGERAIQTPEFVKVRAVLNKWLDEQAKP